MTAELILLVEKWKRIAAIKFKHAEGEETEFGKRFTEHGATCYFNCANELEHLIKTGNASFDLTAQILNQDLESP